jgi:hypothetical protein
MDPRDYAELWRAIGNNNIEVDCTVWEDMESTYAASQQAQVKEVIEYFQDAHTAFYLYDTPEELRFRELFSNIVDTGYDLSIKAAIFWNTLKCPANQETGVATVFSNPSWWYQSQDVIWEEVGPRTGNSALPNELLASRFTVPNIPGISIDFTGKTTFIEQYYTDYIEALDVYNETIRKCFTYVNGTQFPKAATFTQPSLTVKCDMPEFTGVSANVGSTSVTLNADLTSIGTLPNATIVDVGFYFSPKDGALDFSERISLGNTLGPITTTIVTTEGTTYNWAPYAEFNWDSTDTGGTDTVPYLYTPVAEELTTDPDALTIYYLTDNNPVSLFQVDTANDSQDFTVRWVPIDTNKQTVVKNYSFAQSTGVHIITEEIYEAGGSSQYYKMQIFGTNLTNFALDFGSSNSIRIRNPRILNWGNNPWKSLRGAFQNNPVIGMAATDAPNLTQCTDISFMFYNCTQVGRVYSGDFDGNGIRRNGDWTSWDVSNIVQASYMLFGCRYFTADFGAWSWDSAEDLSYFFSTTLDGNADFSQWVNIGPVGGTINLQGFYQTAIKQTKPVFDLNNVRPNRIKLDEFLFAARELAQDLSSWGPKISALQAYDPAVGISLGNMLRNRTVDQVTDFSTWDMSNVSQANSMFQDYRFANGVTGLSNITWNNMGTGNLTQNFSSMFYGAVNVPDVNNWSFTNVGNFNSMFRQCSFANPAQSLNGWTMNLNFGAFSNSRMNFENMFRDIEGTNGQVPAVDAWVINQPVVPSNPFPYITFRGMFAQNSNFNQDLTNWAVQGEVDIREMFWLCDNFNSGDAQGVYGNKLLTWNVEFRDAYQAFWRATNFNQNIGHWTWKQGSTQGMFATNNNGFNKMNFDQDISGWGFGAGSTNFQSTLQFESFHVNADGTNQFSTANLDSLLISIAQNILNSGITNGKTNIVFQVDGQPSCLPVATGGPYTVAGDILGVQDAIAYLNGTLGWTITTNACI